MHLGVHTRTASVCCASAAPTNTHTDLKYNRITMERVVQKIYDSILFFLFSHVIILNKYNNDKSNKSYYYDYYSSDQSNGSDILTHVTQRSEHNIVRVNERRLCVVEFKVVCVKVISCSASLCCNVCE